MLRQNKGITLVALVITIIVMLILAGVSISLVVGDNGVLNQATNAADKSADANAEDEVKLALTSAQNDFFAYGSTSYGDGSSSATTLLDYIYDSSTGKLTDEFTKYVTGYTCSDTVTYTAATTTTDATLKFTFGEGTVTTGWTATITFTSDVSATIEFD